MRYVLISINAETNKIGLIAMQRNLTYNGAKVYDYFPNFFTIAVLWDRETYNWCIEHGLKKSRYVIVREALAIFTGAKDSSQTYTFKSALKNFGVAFDSLLLFDEGQNVKYLAELLKKIYQYYLLEERQNYYGEFFESRNSHILHNEKCYYVKRIKTDNIAPAERTKIFEGFIPCKYCRAKKYFSRSKTFQGDYITNLSEYCDEYSLKYSTENDIITIKSKVGSWKIYCKNERVRSVFHSYHKNNVSRNDFEYHREHIRSKTLHRIIRYIAHHDGKWRRRKMWYIKQ